MGYVKEHVKMDKIDKIIMAMEPIDGEMRTVCECGKCGQLFGRRFIPFGLGTGLTINPCHCIITNNQHGDYKTLRESRP